MQNFGAQAERAAIIMNANLEPACKQLEAALGEPSC